MEKNDSNNLHGKKNTGKIRIAFSAMIAFVLFLAEIYMMINTFEYFEGLVAVTVLLIAVIYILVTSIIQVNYEKEQSLLDELDSIFNSEKATYILLKKNFEGFNDRLAYLEDNTSAPTEEIIAAQKAIAKVNISRNKENTDALMNSNEKMLEKIFNFEKVIESNNNKLLEQQRLMIEQANKEIMLKQQESAARMKELELSIKNQILQFMSDVSNSRTIMPEQSHSFEEIERIEDNEPEIGIFDNEEPIIDSEDGPVLDFEDDLTLAFEEEPIQIDPIDLAVEESMETEQFEMVEEPKEAEQFEMPEEPKEVEQFEMPEESKEVEQFEMPEESKEAEQFEMSEEPKEEEQFEMPEEPKEAERFEMPEEPKEVEQQSDAVLADDPNKKMSEDDIAALLASISGADTASDPKPDQQESAPIIEEPAPTVNTSDPNKMMTPDDIAALLANM